MFCLVPLFCLFVSILHTLFDYKSIYIFLAQFKAILLAIGAYDKFAYLKHSSHQPRTTEIKATLHCSRLVCCISVVVSSLVRIDVIQFVCMHQ